MPDPATVTLSSLSLSAATYAERYTLPAFRLRVVSGPDAGVEAVFARRAVVVGSGPDCDLSLSDAAVSRQHLRIVGSRSGYRVSDLGSKNGTWFAGARLGEVTLGASATLRLGQTELQYDQLPDLHEISLSREPEFGGMQGSSEDMRELFAQLAALADGDDPVAIAGEPGTGKRLAAEALHRRSRRAAGALEVFDCSTATADDVERALTLPGDVRLRAHGGSLIVLELDEVPLPLQPALLKALTSAVGAPVRLIATLNAPLQQAVREGRLHRDWIKVFGHNQVTLPALRHRLADLPDLVAHLLDELQRTRRDAQPLTLSWQTLQALLAYDWPGNVRQLRRHLERAAQLATSAPTPLAVQQPATHAQHGIQPLAPDGEPLPPYAEARQRMLQQFDQAYCTQLLSATGQKSAAAAQIAGLTRASFDALVRRALGDAAPT